MKSIAAIAALLLAGCGTDDAQVKTASSVAAHAAIDGALLSKSWPAKMADDAHRSRFEGHTGWQAVFENDLAVALSGFDSNNDHRGLARVHQGLSDLYHQAALLYANAAVEAYESDGQKSDPEDLAYVVGVSHIIRGDAEKAKLALSRVDGSGPFAARAAAWTASINSDLQMPGLEALSSISGSLGEVAVGQEPPYDAEPDAMLPENTERAKLLKVVDPTRLLTRSAWHREAARTVAPKTDAGVLDQIATRYSVGPLRTESYVALPLDDAWLFASPDLVPADVSFVAEAKSVGVAAVSAWADKSVLAAAIQPAILDGKVVPQKVQDAGFAVQKQLQAMMKDIGGGEMGFHRPFAQRARVAVLMAGMVVADANDQFRDAGILRLNALERMEQMGTDPVFALAVSAWDAGNRNPMRPEELIHQFKSSFPALSAARGPLEALHLRLSRNAGPANPVH